MSYEFRKANLLHQVQRIEAKVIKLNPLDNAKAANEKLLADIRQFIKAADEEIVKKQGYTAPRDFQGIGSRLRDNWNRQ